MFVFGGAMQNYAEVYEKKAGWTKSRMKSL